MSWSWDLPYRSQRQPILGDDVIATSQPLAVAAAMHAYERGGNAADAVLAAAMALTVVEPTGNGVGSDAFAIVHDGAEIHGLNASGRSPAGLDVERLLALDAIPLDGWDPVTVPGAVSAWAALSQRFGRLDLSEVAAPAIRLASGGFPVSPLVAAAWARAASRHGHREDFRDHYLPRGRAPRAGERFASADLAATLQEIAETGGESFYRGRLAQRIAAHAADQGGPLTEADLAHHAPEWVEPLSVAYRDVVLHELPPNGQGVAALLAVAILEHLDPAPEPDGAEAVHLAAEAMKRAFAEAHREVADPTAMTTTPAQLLAAHRVSLLARGIDPQRAGDPGHGEPRYGGTVYLAAADRDGLAVSFIQSNYVGFGSGVVVPGTGISLQDRGAGFTTERGHPNQVEASKRPFHTIIPGFLTGAVHGPIGVMGGPMQPQGHLQLVTRIVDHAQNPQAAIDAPRWRVGAGRELYAEAGLPGRAVEHLRGRGHDVREVGLWDAQFGGAQLALRCGDAWLAASDPRKDGHAGAR